MSTRPSSTRREMYREAGAQYLFVDSPDCRIDRVKGTFVAEEGYGDHPVTMVSYLWSRGLCEAGPGNGFPPRRSGKRRPAGGWRTNNTRGGTISPRFRPIMEGSAWGRPPLGCLPRTRWGSTICRVTSPRWSPTTTTERYYRSSPPADPKGPETGEVHAVRGGSWLSAADGVGVYVREAGALPYISLPNVGFRCAKDAP